MMVWCRGWGIVSAVLPGIGLLSAQAIAEMFAPDGDIWWRPSLVLFITAFNSLCVYLALFKASDAATRKADPLLFRHHLLFLPMGLHWVFFLCVGLVEWFSFRPHP